MAAPSAFRWYRRLLDATEDQRNRWEICGGGYGIHWHELDEDLNPEGLLCRAVAPRQLVTAQPPDR